MPPDAVLSTLAECPEKTLRAHPAALLVLMRCMFNWNRVPEMQKLKQQLLAAVDEHPEWGTEERGNLLAECDLLQSFLYYNDIDAMSRMYLSASARLTRPATNICPGRRVDLRFSLGADDVPPSARSAGPGAGGDG